MKSFKVRFVSFFLILVCVNQDTNKLLVVPCHYFHWKILRLRSTVAHAECTSYKAAFLKRCSCFHNRALVLVACEEYTKNRYSRSQDTGVPPKVV